MRHVLSAQQFDASELGSIFDQADSMRDAMRDREGKRELATTHLGTVAATLFYEPSTRTRLSFESAAQRLGMGLVSTENAGEFSSAIKGETIEDTIRVVDDYADVIVLRHKDAGAVDKAAAVSTVPVINAGDGKGEHPTQALLDTYTIHHAKGTLENLTVVIGGDLAHGRTVRSLAQMLSHYTGNEIRFVSVPELQIGDDIKAHLREKGVRFSETDDMHEALHGADVVYWTRLQKERLEDPSLESAFVIDQLALQAMPDTAIIMHPLPRVDEIHTNVDHDPRAKYFEQAENGLYIRMALIDRLLQSSS
jgi:aspartate carbamoyltransferase catalytic subunit